MKILNATKNLQRPVEMDQALFVLAVRGKDFPQAGDNLAHSFRFVCLINKELCLLVSRKAVLPLCSPVVDEA